MVSNGSNIPLAYLLQPELLQEHEIRSILVERCVRVENIEHYNKEQLLNIFYRVITPLQQRTRNERRLELNGINKNISQMNIASSPVRNGILKQVTDENNAKKIKLSPSHNKVQLKRPNIDKSTNDDIPVMKKARKKITWP